jgi:hypothetical protein
MCFMRRILCYRLRYFEDCFASDNLDFPQTVIEFPRMRTREDVRAFSVGASFIHSCLYHPTFLSCSSSEVASRFLQTDVAKVRAARAFGNLAWTQRSRARDHEVDRSHVLV